jgi:exopolysaccharide biosynthesis polyprenyl glycosylphosphotransferase
MSSGPDNQHAHLGEDGTLLYPDVRRTPTLVGRGLGIAPRPLGRRDERLIHVVLALADTLALVAAFLVSCEVGGADRSATTFGVLVATIPAWIIGLKSYGLYDRESDAVAHSTIDELAPLARVATVGGWLFLVLAWVTGRPAPVSQSIVFWLALLVLLPLLRALARPLFRATRTYPQNTVIVGAGSVGQLIGRKLQTNREYHVNLLGFIDAMPKERRDDLRLLTILGRPDELEEIVADYNVERVIIAFSNDSHEETMGLIRTLKDLDVRIDIVPRLFDIIPPRLTSHTIEGIPLITLPRLRLSTTSLFLKRAFDVLVSSIVVVALGPTFALLAILIKLDSKGPVFYRQLRMGTGGRTFSIFKFRTMVINADELKDEIAHLNTHAAPGGDPRMFKVKHDPRVTRMGRLLRRSSLDELPQLFNVLKGDMSLIGPRPLILEEDRHVEDWARKRLALKPGMTGLWQVSGRNSIPFEDMVKLDYLYVTTWSLASDCRLLLQTVPLVLAGDRGGHW